MIECLYVCPDCDHDWSRVTDLRRAATCPHCGREDIEPDEVIGSEEPDYEAKYQFGSHRED